MEVYRMPQHNRITTNTRRTKKMRENTKLYRELASLIQARLNCIKSNNVEWLREHEDRILELSHKHMPSGSGIDSGTKIDLDRSKPNKLIFTFGFHHMHESGMYDGWTEHELHVMPSLTQDFELRITGPDRNDVKEYLYEVYSHALDQAVKTFCETCQHYVYGREWFTEENYKTVFVPDCGHGPHFHKCGKNWHAVSYACIKDECKGIDVIDCQRCVDYERSQAEHESRRLAKS